MFKFYLYLYLDYKEFRKGGQLKIPNKKGTSPFFRVLLEKGAVPFLSYPPALLGALRFTLVPPLEPMIDQI